MKQKLRLLVLLISSLSFSQVQIGVDIDGEASGDSSGQAVSISPDGLVVAIGAHANDGNGNRSGHVRIYENQNEVWTQIGADIDGEAAEDFSGQSVSLSLDGSIVAIGGSENNGGAGHVRIYENLNEVWTQIGADIDGEAAGDSSGRSVSLSLDGSVVAIGARLNSDNGAQSGHVRIYENLNEVWTQVGADISGEATGDQSGFSVSLSSDGSVVAIGAIENDDNGSNSGHVRIYENLNEVWTQVGADINGEATGDSSGRSVSLSSDGSVVAIGAPENNSRSGHIRIYENLNGVWTQIGNDIDGEALVDLLGQSVSLSSDGSVVAMGAFGNDGINGANSGHVRIYENQNEVWTQVGIDIDGEAAGDFSGFSVSLSSNGSVVVIGAGANDGNGGQSGHARVYDLSGELSTNEFVLSQFKLFPNPAKNQFTIQLDPSVQLEYVRIYNLLGQAVLVSEESTINTSKLSSGSYLVEINTNKGKATKKLIID